MNDRRFFKTGWDMKPNGNILKIVDGVLYTIIWYENGYSIYSDNGKVTRIQTVDEVKDEVYRLAYGRYPEDEYPEDNSNLSPKFSKNPMFIELVKQGYRALSKKYHPDMVGGDAEKMKQLNNLFEEIEQQL